jgi:ubiquinone/menaquinone biosynthesis C-methylase UbiE
MKQLKTFFSQKNIKSFLDVGTGNGYFIASILNVFPTVQITGIDPSEVALKEACETYPNFKFLRMEGENLKFDDNSFDAASISMALHHLPNVTQTLAEMQRVVKPGGWLIVNELFSDRLNPAQEVHKAMHHFRSRIDRLNGVSHNKTFTKNEILNLLKAAGLSVELHFENTKAAQQPEGDEIEMRKQKLLNMLDSIKHLPAYHEMLREVPQIEQNLKIHGFQMATCLVAVTRVS